MFVYFNHMRTYNIMRVKLANNLNIILKVTLSTAYGALGMNVIDKTCLYCSNVAILLSLISKIMVLTQKNKE